MAVVFSAQEKKQILVWYEYYSQDSRHYGDGVVMFPSEAILIRKLESGDEESFGDYELELIRDWMNFNIRRRYGDAKYLLGAELDLFHKLQSGFEG